MSTIMPLHPKVGSARNLAPGPLLAPLTLIDEDALIDHGHALQRAVAAGRLQPLLRGKNLGLLCADDTQPQAQLFLRAAGELGAHVAHIGMSLSERSSSHEVLHTAKLLGRLYDAVECQGLPSALVRQMAQAAGIPVYDALAANEPLLSQLAGQLGGDTEPNRRIALQAVLLHTVV